MPTLNATINYFDRVSQKEVSHVCKDRRGLLQQINKLMEDNPKASSFVFVVVPQRRSK